MINQYWTVVDVFWYEAMYGNLATGTGQKHRKLGSWCRSPGWGSKPGPAEYETVMPTSRPWRWALEFRLRRAVPLACPVLPSTVDVRVWVFGSVMTLLQVYECLDSKEEGKDLFWGCDGPLKAVSSRLPGGNWWIMWKHLGVDVRWRGLDSNAVPPVYKSRALLLYLLPKVVNIGHHWLRSLCYVISDRFIQSEFSRGCDLVIPL